MSRIIVLESRRGKDLSQELNENIFVYYERLGIEVISYKSFFKEKEYKNIKKDDIIIVYCDIDNNQEFNDTFKKIKCKKLLRTIDAYNTDGIPHRKSIELSKQLEINNFLVAYSNKNMENYLHSQNINFCLVPHCLDFENKRNYKEKDYDIGISGQLHFEAYPARTRVFNYYQKCNKNLKISLLPWPGYWKNEAKHNIIGEKYIDFLSQNWLNVCCRGGWRNGMVTKYLEIGKSFSLPIADIPEQMNHRMKEIIININDEIDNMQLNELIQNELSNKNILIEKIKEYQNICQQEYDFRKVIPDMIKSAKEL